MCLAHQNERSGGFASGTICFASEPDGNKELGSILGKNHVIQVWVNRSSSRLSVYHGIQIKNNRKPKLNPDPANETRWNATIDETIQANVIMGDICDTIDELVSPMGEDHYMLNRQELDDINFSRLTYTDHDIMI